MEKRGSGLRKMRELTENLPNFLIGKEPYYKMEATSFFATFYNLNWSKNGRIPVEEVANRVNSVLEKYLVNEEKFGESHRSSESEFGDTADKPKNIGRTAQKIIDLVISDPSMSAEAMAYKIGISSRAVGRKSANFLKSPYARRRPRNPLLDIRVIYANIVWIYFVYR